MAQLLTIPYSHYVEFARWSLQLGGKKFEETKYMPGQHILPMLALRWTGAHIFCFWFFLVLVVVVVAAAAVVVDVVLPNGLGVKIYFLSELTSTF